MAKGEVAKAKIIEKLQQIYDKDFIGIQDRKIYVRESDGAEKVQIAITLTCPKIPLEDAFPQASSSEITQEEDRNLEELMKKIGL